MPAQAGSWKAIWSAGSFRDLLCADAALAATENRIGTMFSWLWPFRINLRPLPADILLHILSFHDPDLVFAKLIQLIHQFVNHPIRGLDLPLDQFFLVETLKVFPADSRHIWRNNLSDCDNSQARKPLGSHIIFIYYSKEKNRANPSPDSRISNSDSRYFFFPNFFIKTSVNVG